MFKKLILVTAIALLSGTIYAQSNFLPAKIIIKGEVQNGLIDYQNWATNPTFITFKSNDNSEVVSYDASQVEKFEVANESYISANVRYKDKKFVAEAARQGDGPKIVTGKVFLRVLVEGEKSLYHFLIREAHNYYIKVDSNYILLENNKRFQRDPVTGEQLNSFTESKKYIGQLAFYLQGNKTKAKINNAKYTMSSLMTIFNDYYNETGSSNTYEFKIEQSKVVYGLIAGTSLNLLSFSGEILDKITAADFGGSIGFAFGGFAELTSARNHGKSQFQFELLLSKVDFESVHSAEFGHAGTVNYYNTELAYTMLNFNTMYRYKVINKKSQLYLSPGLGFSYLIGETNLSNITTKSPHMDDRIKQEEALPRGRSKLDMSLKAGVGVLYDKFSFELRYSQSLRFEELVHIRSNSKVITLLIGYKF